MARARSHHSARVPGRSRGDDRARATNPHGLSQRLFDERYPREVELYDELYGPLPPESRPSPFEWSDPVGELATRIADLPNLTREADRIAELRAEGRAARRAASDARRAAMDARERFDGFPAPIAAELLGVPLQRFYRRIQTGKIPAEKIGGRYMVPRSVVVEALRESA